MDLSRDPHHYDIRRVGQLWKVETGAVTAKHVRCCEKISVARQQLAWGPDEPQLDWTDVSRPHPRRYDILVLGLRQDAWSPVGVKLGTNQYAHCNKTTPNLNENRSWRLGYHPSTDLLGPGQPGGPADGQIVCLLTLVKKCKEGHWHLPAQFKLRNEKDRVEQTDATCMETLFDIPSKQLKCKVCSSCPGNGLGPTSYAFLQHGHSLLRMACSSRPGF